MWGIDDRGSPRFLHALGAKPDASLLSPAATEAPRTPPKELNANWRPLTHTDAIRPGTFPSQRVGCCDFCIQPQTRTAHQFTCQ